MTFLLNSCYQSIKDKNFESNSQQYVSAPDLEMSCYQSIKDKNFESNSQPVPRVYMQTKAVISLSKIKISKAIHNSQGEYLREQGAVISLSKIKISKFLSLID